MPSHSKKGAASARAAMLAQWIGEADREVFVLALTRRLAAPDRLLGIAATMHP